MSTTAPSVLTSGDFEVDRRRHLHAARERLPAEVEKLTWPLERLHALRDERLRALVRTAKARSPWHARRLRYVDPDTLRGDDLSVIAPMTKDDLMANWDEIVTDRRLTLDLANTHLRRVAESGLAYLLGDDMVIASGGSSGKRGVFVWDFAGWLDTYLALARHSAWVDQHLPQAGERRAADVTAETAIHGTTAFGLTFAGLAGRGTRFPVTLPLAEIVAGLNAFQPTVLSGYPSALHRLALEAQAGRLRIAPKRLGCGGEPLLPEARRAMEDTFSASVVNVYAASEAVWIAMSFPGSAGLHLSEDTGVYEPVDMQGHPVPPGTAAAKLLLTNVVNHVLPLIRYELTDEVTFLDEPNPDPWTGRRIADIQGRLDDVFTYANGVTVHPHVFRSALGAMPQICEYQVRQSARGADVFVRLDRAIALDSVRHELVQSLTRVGLAAPEITVTAVDTIERVAATSKLKRFVPLPSSPQIAEPALQSQQQAENMALAGQTPTARRGGL